MTRSALPSILVVSLCLSVGCGHPDTAVLPADSWLADRTAAGWEISEVVKCPPYIAAALCRADEPLEGPGPYRVRLGIRENGGVRLLKEWSQEDCYYILAEPQFCTNFGNGRPVFVFTRCHGGNGWTGERLALYEIDGRGLREVTPREMPSRWAATGVRDVNNDGTSELLVLNAEYEFYAGFCHASSPGCLRIFRWDSGSRQFTDQSADYRVFYESDIGQHRADMTGTLDGDNTGEFFLGRAISILLDYSCMGRTQEGWQEFEKDLALLKQHVSASRLKEIAEVEADLKKRLEVDAAR